MEEKIATEELLEILKIALKDELVASVRKHGDELTLEFPSGQRFGLLLWEEKE